MLPLRSLLPNFATTRHGRQALAASMVSAACPMVAHALQPEVGEAPALEVRSELVVPQADSGAAFVPGQASAARVAQRSSVWARRGAAAVGLGVQTPQAPGSANYGALAASTVSSDRVSLAPANLVVGMSLDTSTRSRLVVDTPVLPAPRLDDSLNPAANSREVRVGLQIKPADPLKSLRAGQLFKLELSTRSQLALKPRSGGMMMSYSAKF